MTPELFGAFVAATVVLILVPGPNVALIVANSISHGPRYGLVTVAGTSSAMVIQLAFTVLGLTGMLALMAVWFEWLRWLGVAYLVYLGITTWCAPATDLKGAKPLAKSAREMYLRGMIVSLTNPKTLLFYAAFLPQFVSTEHDQAWQLTLLAVTFLFIAMVLDSAWALLAHRASRVFGLSGRLLNRLSGGLLLTAATGLALVRRP